jgi:hypothetical protein
MIEAFSNLSIDLKFDEKGIIENYRDVSEALLRKKNELEQSYNAGGLDDEGFEEAMKPIEKALELLDNYEETLDL